MEEKYVSLFLCLIGLGMGLLIYGYYFNLQWAIRGVACVGVSFMILITLPLHQERQLFKEGKSYQFIGQVERVSISPYYKWVTLNRVEERTLSRKIKNKIQIRVPLTQQVSTYDLLDVEGQCLVREPQMNPSDFDYEMYLKGEKIVETFKMQKLNHYEEKHPFIEQIKEELTRRIENLFTPEKVGIIEAALLGDDSRLNEQTEAIYQQAGISHVLCISGFHVGVIISALMGIMKLMPIPYTIRQIIMIVGIWGYALLTGCATSTVRATLMVTIHLLGNCLWEEEDGLTSLAVAAFIILVLNPYQLFMAGFELSFMAVLGIILCNNEIEKKELRVEWKYTKWQRTLLIWSSVQFFTWPIIAYYFYEVPFLMCMLNLVIIPIFSWIIIGGWFVLGCSYILPILAGIGSLGIEGILSCIEYVVEKLVKLPLATLCIGRPNFLEYSLYIGSVLLIGATLWGYCAKRRLYQGLLIVSCLYISSIWIKPKTLKLTGLYVGQGDCTVMEVPSYGPVIIDGGNFGKGSVVERYIKYLGYDEIQGIMVSHSDADHIGGILELLNTNLQINQVFVSECDESEHLTTLIKKCQLKNIPIYYLESGEKIQYGHLKVECMAPVQGTFYENINDASLVCKISYGHFSALFTGDKSINQDQEIYDDTGAITLLKVSHHGSRTGTSYDMLLKLKPRYAMISCGRANLYGHPHQEVTTLLENADIEMNRTDQDGAICYETDGTYLTETSYRKDA